MSNPRQHNENYTPEDSLTYLSHAVTAQIDDAKHLINHGWADHHAVDDELPEYLEDAMFVLNNARKL